MLRLILWLCLEVSGAASADEPTFGPRLIHEDVRIPAAGGRYSVAASNLRPQGDGPFGAVVLNHGTTGSASGRARESSELLMSSAAVFARRGYRDDAQAYRLFRRAAAKGHAESQYQSGRALERGLGTARNLGEAFLWYEQAAKQGHALAQTATGVFLKKGQGVRRDDTKALEWLTRAAQGGSADAYFHLGEMHTVGTSRGHGDGLHGLSEEQQEPCHVDPVLLRVVPPGFALCWVRCTFSLP
jgi:hypothetical protein